MKSTKITAFALATMALAACSDNDVVQSTTQTDPNVISYNVVTNNSTRAASLYGSNSTAKPDFWVWSRTYKAPTTSTDASADASASTTTENASIYFSGDEVKYDDSKFTDVTATRYWPSKYALDFYAYANKNDYFTKTGTTAYDNGNCADVTISPFTETFTKGTLNAHDAELEIANVSLDNDVAKQEDMLYAATFNQTKADNSAEGVGMNFRHAFAQLAFQFQNVNKGIQVKVDEIRLVNIYTKGTVTFSEKTDENYKYGLTDYDAYTTCSWDENSLGVLNVYQPNCLPFAGYAPYESSYTYDGTTVTRKNWAYEKLVGKGWHNAPEDLLTLKYGEAAKMLYPMTSSTSKLAALEDEYATYKELIEKVNGDDQEAARDAYYELADQVEELPSYISVTNEGNSYYTFSLDEEAYKKAKQYAIHEDAMADETNATNNAMYVIPQDVTAGVVPASTSGKYLSDVTGMYFLIKCSIQNIADPDANNGDPTDDDVWLLGDKPTTINNSMEGDPDKIIITDANTRFVLVPVLQTNYEADNEGNFGTQGSTPYLTKWEAGKKYVYTFIFGADGSNGGVPVGEDPEGTAPDEDPDDDTPLDPTPTLTSIKYNVSAFTIDCYADGRNANVNVDSAAPAAPAAE